MVGHDALSQAEEELLCGLVILCHTRVRRQECITQGFPHLLFKPMKMKKNYIKPVATVEVMVTEYAILGDSPERSTTSIDIRFADIDESQLPVEADGNNYRFDPWGNE